MNYISPDKYTSVAVDIRGKKIDSLWVCFFERHWIIRIRIHYRGSYSRNFVFGLLSKNFRHLCEYLFAMWRIDFRYLRPLLIHVYSSLLAALAPRHMLWRLISARYARDVGSFPRSKNCSFILKYCFCFVKGCNLPSMRRAWHPSNRLDNISLSLSKECIIQDYRWCIILIANYGTCKQNIVANNHFINRSLLLSMFSGWHRTPLFARDYSPLSGIIIMTLLHLINAVNSDKVKYRVHHFLHFLCSVIRYRDNLMERIYQRLVESERRSGRRICFEKKSSPIIRVTLATGITGPKD